MKEKNRGNSETGIVPQTRVATFTDEGGCTVTETSGFILTFG